MYVLSLSEVCYHGPTIFFEKASKVTYRDNDIALNIFVCFSTEHNFYKKIISNFKDFLYDTCTCSTLLRLTTGTQCM